MRPLPFSLAADELRQKHYRRRLFGGGCPGKDRFPFHEPRRILTDSLHLDETLLTVVPKSHLAGAYYLDGEPGLSFIAKETETLTKVREYTPERIAALQPDVFVVSDWSDPLLVKK